MARYRLSSDILSPIHSDISLNDGSAFSFGSLPGTPVFENNITSPVCSAMDADIKLPCTKTRECADTFDKITNDIKNQTNSGKEEKYKESFNVLKKSTDDLFNSDDSCPSISFLKQSKNELKVHAKINIVKVSRDSKNLNLQKKRNSSSNLTKIPEGAEKKSEPRKAENVVENRQRPSKSTSSELEVVKGTKSRKSVLKNNADASQKKNASTDQKIHSKASSKNDGTSSETKTGSSEVLPKKNKEKESETVKKYDFKCQKKIPVSKDVPIMDEHKDSSISPMQLAISMEMDNMRGFVLHQNLFIRKELWKLQEIAKKQNEDIKHLFSVVDELLDMNRKLISQYN